MVYNEIKPGLALQPYIDTYWQLKGEVTDNQWERIFPDGCPGIVINLGDDCRTDNGLTIMEHGKTYVVGTMTSFKESFINSGTNLLGVCLKPGVFPSVFSYVAQKELTDHTVEFDRNLSFDTARVIKDKEEYLNRYFCGKAKDIDAGFQRILHDIAVSKGKLSISQIASRNCITVRQLERAFAVNIGLSPKEYSNIIRFRHALSQIESSPGKCFSEIAFECGYYDHAHLGNEIKKLSGLTPSEL